MMMNMIGSSGSFFVGVLSLWQSGQLQLGGFQSFHR